MKGYVFWDIMPGSPLKVNWCFWRICRLHLQGQRISKVRNQSEKNGKQSLLDLFFDPETGGDTFLGNFGWFSTDFTALCPRRYNPWGQIFSKCMLRDFVDLIVTDAYLFLLKIYCWKLVHPTQSDHFPSVSLTRYLSYWKLFQNRIHWSWADYISCNVLNIF
jgi:hypothetical protein